MPSKAMEQQDLVSIEEINVEVNCRDGSTPENVPAEPPTKVQDPATRAGSRLYENSIKIQEKIKEKLQKAPDGCTFQPNLRKTRMSQKVATPEGKSRFTALYENAKKTTEKLEERRKSAEKVTYSFSPKITEKTRRRSTASTPNGPKESSYDRLYKTAEAMKERQALREQQNSEECTFKPKINASARKPKVQRKLYDIERVRQQKQEREDKKNAHEVEACTFKPHINARSLASASKKKDEKQLGFYDRLMQKDKASKEKLERARREREKAELREASFKPNVPHAHRKSNDIKPVFQRLLTDRREVIAKREEQKENELKQKHTFKPLITKIPKKDLKQTDSIFERLYKDGELKEETLKKRESIKLMNETEGCTFSPAIASATDIPLKVHDEPIWERLASMDKNQIYEERDQAHKLRSLKECTFKPQISETPTKSEPFNTVSRKESIFERLSKKPQPKEMTIATYEERQLEECTFSPRISCKEPMRPRKTEATNQSGVDPAGVNISALKLASNTSPNNNGPKEDFSPEAEEVSAGNNDTDPCSSVLEKEKLQSTNAEELLLSA